MAREAPHGARATILVRGVPKLGVGGPSVELPVGPGPRSRRDDEGDDDVDDDDDDDDDRGRYWRPRTDAERQARAGVLG